MPARNAFQTVQRHGLHERLTQLCEISQSLYFGVEMRSTRWVALILAAGAQPALRPLQASGRRGS